MLDPKAVAALAGLAPLANQSGSNGGGFMAVGRMCGMCCILSATRFNEALLSAADRAREGRAGGGHAQARTYPRNGKNTQRGNSH